MKEKKIVHPEEIENIILENTDYIRDLVVHEKTVEKGSKSYSCIAATISLMPDSPLALLDEESRIAAVTEDIRKINKKIAAYKQISLIYVTLDEFEKTTTHKVVRSKAIREEIYTTV